MEKLITFLKSKDLLGRESRIARTISSYSFVKFHDIIEEAEHFIKTAHRPVESSTFSHSASLGLGGSSSECMEVSCRLKRVNELARFALLYSDKVYISSYFAGYKNICKKDDYHPALENFFNDLIIINEIKDVLLSVSLQFFSPETEICFACQASEFLGVDATVMFNSAYRKLQSKYLDNMQVECEKENEEDFYWYTCNGPEPYFDHPVIYCEDRVLPAIKNRPKIEKTINSGKNVIFSKTLSRELQFHKNLAHQVATNAIHGLATSRCLRTTFLTEKDLHVNFLNSLYSEPEIPQKNIIASKHLTSMVPFVEDVNLKSLIKLRNREKESFLMYRQSLNQAISDFVSSGNSLTENDAKAIYSDVIAPNLALLDKKVKSAKKDLISKPFRSFTGVVGAISFGLLTGIVPPDISSMAQTIGLVKFGSDFIKDLMALGDKERSIENEQLYFLWKIRQKAS